MTGWVIVPAGDAALMVEVAAGIDEATNREVLTLAAVLRAALEGVPDLDVTPAYRSLLVSFRPGALREVDLRRAIEATSPAHVEELEPRVLVIPVVYGGEEGPDLEFVAQYHDVTSDAVTGMHTAQPYRIFCLGFSPGFPYLGGLPEALHTPRLPVPRPHVPAGSVGIAGEQTGIYPTATPGGWRIIGRSPLVLFDPRQKPPTDYRPGDFLQFEPITEREFARLQPMRLTPRGYQPAAGA